MSGFTIPNTPDAFNQNQAEPDSLDFQILGSADTGVVSGMDVIPGSSVTVDVLAGEVLIKGVYYRLATNKTGIALTSAGIDGFFDIVYARINGANTVDVYVTGTATGPNPRFPATGTGVGQINTDTDVVLASVWRTANTAPTSQHITDKRIFVRSNGNRVANTTPTNGTALGSGSSGDTYVNTAWVTNATNLSSPLSVKVGDNWYNLAKYSENFSAGTITANLVGNVTGTAGGVAWTNVSGKPAFSDVFNNGGTYDINIIGRAGYSETSGTAAQAVNSLTLRGLEKSSGGYPNTISEVGSDGMVAARYFGAAQTSANWWYATDFSGTTLFRANIQIQPGGTYGVHNTPITTGRTVIIASTGTLGYQSSSQRYKDNINPVDIDVNAVLQVQPVTYQPKSEFLDGCESTDVFLGVVAEQVDELGLKHLVQYDEQGRPDSFKYDLLSVALLAVIKSQDTRLSALESKIAELEAQ
jgi:hypothetical protein